MPKCQYKNAISNSQGNMAPTDSSYPTTVRPEYSSSAEPQEKDLKNNIMIVIEVLKERK